MAIDTSIYGLLKPVAMPSQMESAKGAAALAGMEMQQKRMGQEMDAEKMAAHLKKASAFGQALEGLAGMSEQERAATYPKVHAELAQAGIISPDQAPAEYDPTFYKASLMRYRATAPGIEARLKEADLGLKQAHARAYDAQAAKDLREKKEGKQLPADKVLAVSEGQRIPNALVDIRQTLEANKDQFGPVSGRLASMNPWNEKAQTIDAQMRAASQSFGRMMEGGVLRKEDEEKYRKMFPQLSDTPEVAANKLALVDRMLKQKQAADVGALEQSGYDTRAFAGGAQVPEVPGVLKGGGGGGLVKEAMADEKPAPKKPISPQDMEAIHWAKRNKKDPRAQQILKMHGVKE